MVTEMTPLVPEKIAPFGPIERYRSRLIVRIEGVKYVSQIISSLEDYDYFSSKQDYREFLTRRLRKEMMNNLEGVIFK